MTCRNVGEILGYSVASAALGLAGGAISSILLKTDMISSLFQGSVFEAVSTFTIQILSKDPQRNDCCIPLLSAGIGILVSYCFVKIVKPIPTKDFTKNIMVISMVSFSVLSLFYCAWKNRNCCQKKRNEWLVEVHSDISHASEHSQYIQLTLVDEKSPRGDGHT